MNTNTDPFAEFKAAQKDGWALFTAFEPLTIPPAAHLVEFAGVRSGEKVLDVGCGPGAVALTAVKTGALVRALDLAPVLLERARKNASISGLEVDFMEGDVEAMPYQDNSFDVVLSQFGHIFAPRPEVAIAEMLRVLKPGGRIAFSTWPPEHYTGRMFALIAQYAPGPPGAAPPTQWGDPNVVRARLADNVTELHFERELMLSPALSARHFRNAMEAVAPPLINLLAKLKDDAPTLAKFRAELEALITSYTVKNTVRQHYLMSRARKK